MSDSSAMPPPAPNLEEPGAKSWWRRWWGIAGIILLLLVIIALLTGEEDESGQQAVSSSPSGTASATSSPTARPTAQSDTPSDQLDDLAIGTAVTIEGVTVSVNSVVDGQPAVLGDTYEVNVTYVNNSGRLVSLTPYDWATVLHSGSTKAHVGGDVSFHLENIRDGESFTGNVTLWEDGSPERIIFDPSLWTDETATWVLRGGQVEAVEETTTPEAPTDAGPAYDAATVEGVFLEQLGGREIKDMCDSAYTHWGCFYEGVATTPGYLQVDLATDGGWSRADLDELATSTGRHWFNFIGCDYPDLDTIVVTINGIDHNTYRRQFSSINC